MPELSPRIRRRAVADRWSEWRATWLALGALVLIAAAAFLWARQDARRLVWLPNGVMLVARQGPATFFPDSGYAVTLGAHEGGAYPVRIGAWYTWQDATISERAIRRGIEGVVEQRQGARLERVAGGMMDATAGAGSFPPYVLIGLDFWQLGGFRLDVRLRCPVSLPGTQPTTMEQEIATSRGGISATGMLDVALTNALNQAARARCPGDRSRRAVASSTDRPQASLGRVEASSAAAAAAPVSPAASDIVLEPASVPAAEIVSPPATIARGDSIALARVSARGQEVTTLVMLTDTLQISVGAAVNPLHALRITALRADGSALDRFVPLYSVDDPRIAQFGAGGLRALSPGVTRVVVRPMLSPMKRGDGPRLAADVSATFLVRVTP